MIYIASIIVLVISACIWSTRILRLITWTWFFIIAMTNTIHPCIDNNPILNMLFERLIKMTSSELDVQNAVNHVPSVDYTPGLDVYSELERLSNGWTIPSAIRSVYPELEESITLNSLNDTFSDAFVNMINSTRHGVDEHAINCKGKEKMHKNVHFGTALKSFKNKEISTTFIFPGLARVQQRGLNFEKKFGEYFQRFNYTKLGGRFKDGSFKPWGRQLWISQTTQQQLMRSGHPPGTGLHADMCSSLSVQISGSKTWNIYEDGWEHMFKPTVQWGKPIFYGDITALQRADGVPQLKMDMRPGDVLFTPEWMWHTVFMTTDKVTISHTIRICDWLQNFRKIPMAVGASHTMWSSMWNQPQRWLRMLKNIFGLSVREDGFFDKEL